MNVDGEELPALGHVVASQDPLDGGLRVGAGCHEQQALLGQPLTVYGEGQQTRSFCYVDDLIDAIMLFMETPDDLAGPVNIGNPQETTVKLLAETVLKLCGSKSKTVSAPLPQDDPKQRRPDITKIQALTGWEPATGLEEGLRRTIGYFRGLRLEA